MTPYVHTPPYIWTPTIHLDTPICSESFNRVFILLFLKTFSYFRGSHGGLLDLGVSLCPLCLYTPIHLDTYHTFGHPHFFRVLIWYLFCCILNVFLLKRQSWGVVRLRVCPYAPCMFVCPHIFGCPISLDAPICLDTWFRVPAACNFLSWNRR